MKTEIKVIDKVKCNIVRYQLMFEQKNYHFHKMSLKKVN